ncbi:hypothetical protein ACTSKR_06105 [Chitinibacteraceae bacterium HSL-7]
MLFWTTILVGALWLGLSHLHSAMSLAKLPEQASPDGRLYLAAFRSLDDGFGHAQYGDLLALSNRRGLTQPEDGHVIFAGYCKDNVHYRWQDASHIAIRYQGGENKRAPRTLASTAYGIRVSYQSH